MRATKVVITGEGAGENLGGYPHFRRDMLLYNREAQDPEEIKHLPSRGSTNATPPRVVCFCSAAMSAILMGSRG